MQPSTNLFFSNATIFGVCEAIGRDFGFHPNWLRVTLAALLYFNPAAVIATYLGLGLIVAATRWLAPDAVITPEPAARPELLEAGIEQEEERLAA